MKTEADSKRNIYENSGIDGITAYGWCSIASEDSNEGLRRGHQKILKRKGHCCVVANTAYLSAVKRIFWYFTFILSLPEYMFKILKFDVPLIMWVYQCGNLRRQFIVKYVEEIFFDTRLDQ